MRTRNPHGAMLLIAAAVALLLPGCTGSSTSDQPSGSSTGSPAPQVPDLSGGIPVPGHGTRAVTDLQIVDATGYRAYATDREAFLGDMLERIDLATGRQVWQSVLDSADELPTVWLGQDGSVVHTLRSGAAGWAENPDGTAAPEGTVLEQDDFVSVSGEPVQSTLMEAPKWQLSAGGLPPLVLDENGSSLVLSADPEAGSGTAVMELPEYPIAWQGTMQAYAATEQSVLVGKVSKARTLGIAALDRRTGEQRWRLSDDSTNYAYLGRAEDAFLVDAAATAGHQLVWIDAATGDERASTDPVQTPGERLDCQLALTVIACTEGDRGQAISGYDLTSGEQLWSITDGDRQAPTPATSYRDWLYLTTPGAGRTGMVLDARTGAELASNVEVPDILFSNDSGVLVASPTGQSWVPTPG